MYVFFYFKKSFTRSILIRVKKKKHLTRTTVSKSNWRFRVFEINEKKKKQNDRYSNVYFFLFSFFFSFNIVILWTGISRPRTPERRFQSAGRRIILTRPRDSNVDFYRGLRNEIADTIRNSHSRHPENILRPIVKFFRNDSAE